MENIERIFNYVNNNKLLVVALSLAIFVFTEYMNYRNKKYIDTKNPRVKEVLRRRRADLDILNKYIFYVMLVFIAICIGIMFINPTVGFFAYILLSHFIPQAAVGPLLDRVSRRKN